MKGKTLEERYEHEILSDNSGNYAQCAKCVFADKVNYRKGVCAMYTDVKPRFLMKNEVECMYFEAKR